MLRRKNQRAAEEEKKEEGGAPVQQVQKKSPAELRLKKEFAELDLPHHATVTFPKEGDLMRINVAIDLTGEGDSRWKGGKYMFTIQFANAYPYEAPKCHCETPIYHPNIDTEGHVCLNILRADWKPVLGVNPVILGLIFLFIEPNPNDPLNHDAARVLREKPEQFTMNVNRSLQGGTIDGISYPRMK